jgi:hypothetical protein
VKHTRKKNLGYVRMQTAFKEQKKKPKKKSKRKHE